MDERQDRPALTPAALLGQLEACLDAHTQWMETLHRTLVCGMPVEPEQLHEDSHLRSRFGRWYAANGGAELVDQPAFRDLGALDAELHAAARHLLIVHQAGNPIPADLYDLFAAKSAAFTRQIRRLARAFSAAVSDLDPVTGLQNRQAMLGDLENERQRSVRTGAALSVAIADIDHFKRINDTHGHAVGDLALTTAAQTMLRHVRPFDGIYRIGGEEFLIVLPYADLDRAAVVVERLRNELQATPVALAGGGSLRMTVSFGVAQVAGEEALEAAIERADRALYDAKDGGRNRVVKAGSEPVRRA
ncbi:MAG: diguanylate cyclase [Acetobacterales bacterium]